MSETEQLPLELWERISLVDIWAFNLIARTIPEIGRKTLTPKYQQIVIDAFVTYNMFGEPIADGKPHSVYDQPYVGKDGKSNIWYYRGLVHRTVGPASIIYSNVSICLPCIEYYYYGKLHRVDGPARLEFMSGDSFTTHPWKKTYSCDGIKFYQEWIKRDGTKYKKIYFDENGDEILSL